MIPSSYKPAQSQGPGQPQPSSSRVPGPNPAPRPRAEEKRRGHSPGEGVSLKIVQGGAPGLRQGFPSLGAKREENPGSALGGSGSRGRGQIWTSLHSTEAA